MAPPPTIYILFDEIFELTHVQSFFDVNCAN
jgi:hypothetical protein